MQHPRPPRYTNVSAAQMRVWCTLSGQNLRDSGLPPLPPKPPVPVLNAEEIFRTRADQRAQLEAILAQRSDRRRAEEVAAEVRLAQEALEEVDDEFDNDELLRQAGGHDPPKLIRGVQDCARVGTWPIGKEELAVY